MARVIEPFFPRGLRGPEELLSATLPVFPGLVRIYRTQAFEQAVGIRL
jgi:hypothetical protein